MNPDSFTMQKVHDGPKSVQFFKQNITSDLGIILYMTLRCICPCILFYIYKYHEFNSSTYDLICNIMN